MKKIIAAVVILLCIFSPRLYWQWKDAKPVDILIIDKTVPNEQFREHLGLNWFLVNEKITKNNGEYYHKALDYYGYDPAVQKATKPYSHLTTKDLIYVADTYGVYSDDLQDHPEGERSQFLYGGMEMAEWNEIVKSKGEDTVFIAEYNAFASPTEERVSEAMQTFLKVRWTGWIGRYFPELNSSEVPAWLIRNYETQYDRAWDFEKGGIAFTSRTDEVVIIEDNQLQSVVRFKITDEGAGKFGAVEKSNYSYWFDIVEPLEEAQVMAHFEILMDKEAEAQLAEFGLPTIFPAVTHDAEQKIYYFSGDFADYTKENLMKWQGSDRVMKIFSNEESNFFWASYIPLMRQILEEIE